MNVRVVVVGLRLLVAFGLAADAYVHADLASSYSANGTTLTQGDLFLIEAGAASAAALVVLLIPRWYAAAFTFTVAGSALGAVLLYRYVDVGSLGPLPNMYEPLWYPEKTASVIAEAVAATAALLLTALLWSRRVGGPTDHEPPPARTASVPS